MILADIKAPLKPMPQVKLVWHYLKHNLVQIAVPHEQQKMKLIMR